MSEVNLGAISPNIPRLIQQLKNDLFDDWYPDPLGYEDLLKPDVAAKMLHDCFERHHGQFEPQKRVELNIPKKSFVLRYALETSFADRLYYQGLVAQIMPFYDALLPNSVLSHRYATDDAHKRGHLFKKAIPQWTLFRQYVAQEANSKPVILITDLLNFFDNIRVDQILEVLNANIKNLKVNGSEKSLLRRVIAELERCLRKWCYRDSHGLPQNRDASSFLANLAMLPIDRVMLERGYPYYRYMDDIRIAASSRYEARSILQDLITELRKWSLNVNPSKTLILEPGNERYEQELNGSDIKLAHIDSLFNSKSLISIRRSFKPLQELVTSLVTTGDTQERKFRFCVGRLEKLARCSDLSIPDSFFSSMIDVCIEALDNQPFSSDQIIRLLKSAPTTNVQLRAIAELLTDHTKAIYDWQNFLIWQLLVYKGYRDETLLTTARERARNAQKIADRAGAILYLGACGEEADKVSMAANFEALNANYLLQRISLIAIHQLPFDGIVEANVKPHILPGLVGTYRRIRKDYFGKYFRPLPAFSIRNLSDHDNAYD